MQNKDLNVKEKFVRYVQYLGGEKGIFLTKIGKQNLSINNSHPAYTIFWTFAWPKVLKIRQRISNYLFNCLKKTIKILTENDLLSLRKNFAKVK